jgi:pSer/pThr/pTyr-binding forkhead associated (FHA) protein
MKAKTQEAQFSLKCLDQRIQEIFALDKKKILIGSHESCDLKLSDKQVSSYHAFIYLKNAEGFMVKDLYSECGIFVNGRRVEESFVSAGDVLTIGNLSFQVDGSEAEVKITNLDEAIDPIKNVEQNFELPPKEGLIFIDGEYCDIHFDESNFKPLDKVPELQFKADYVQLDESQEALDIIHTTKDKRLEVISYMNGLMMDVTYLSLKNGEFFLDSKKSKNTVLFHTLERSKIFTITDGKLRFYPNESVIPSTEWDKIDLSLPLFLTHGSEQVSLRLVDQGVSWRGIPMLYRDREFYKQGSKIFAGIFLPLLLLLFVTIPKDEDIKEELAVIYTIAKPITKSQEAQEKSDLAAQEVTSKTENTGHKETQQNPQKVEFAAASQNHKAEAKSAAPVAAQSAPVETAPVKSYSFKSSVALNQVVGDAPNINTNGSSKSALKDTSFNTGNSDTGSMVAGADIGVGKFNGSDKSGSGSGSYGSRGLASKSGFDTAYLEPKTVVLGSMDPELLRKILREYIPQFRHCYQAELIGKSDKIKGVIDLNFTINAEGKVGKYNIKVKDAQFSKKGVNCMGNVLSIIDFPKPKGGGVVDVRQPLNFFSETEKI